MNSTTNNTIHCSDEIPYSSEIWKTANAFTYLQSIHIVSTTFAIWGLVILQTAFRADLVRYVSGLKFLFLQLTLIGTSLLNIIIGSLVSKGIIPCTPFLPSTARAARLDNSCVVFYMVLISLCGLPAYCRASDAVVESSQRYRKKRSIA
ncbi:hypothetical protein LSH36_238g03044 [Paralvinella palmiformis]|uniref:Uncharacterized protein n=1 Tax=Paralvinella palmiformis TaxID=53620 RepID=A0AAD9JLY0_9ANNE|nr:hypothetical protein LSH36_238g03044 [Paralvinella palmiformis]